MEITILNEPEILKFINRDIKIPPRTAVCFDRCYELDQINKIPPPLKSILVNQLIKSQSPIFLTGGTLIEEMGYELPPNISPFNNVGKVLATSLNSHSNGQQRHDIDLLTTTPLSVLSILEDSLKLDCQIRKSPQRVWLGYGDTSLCFVDITDPMSFHNGMGAHTTFDQLKTRLAVNATSEILFEKPSDPVALSINNIPDMLLDPKNSKNTWTAVRFIVQSLFHKNGKQVLTITDQFTTLAVKKCLAGLKQYPELNRKASDILTIMSGLYYPLLPPEVAKLLR